MIDDGYGTEGRGSKMRTSVGTRVIVSAMAAILALAGCNSQPAEKADDTPIVEEETESKEVDKTALKEILDEVESTTLDGLTLATGTNLSNAHDEAVTVMSDDDANQAEVDSAERALLSAFDKASRESESYAATSVDEFTVVDAYVEPVNSYGFFDMVVVVQNNTDDAKEFQGVDIAELDANGNIINSYMSYNKNAVDTMVDPGQQLSLRLTCSADDGIAGVRVTRYEYGPSIGSGGDLSETFTKMF